MGPDQKATNRLAGKLDMPPDKIVDKAICTGDDKVINDPMAGPGA